MSSDEFIKHSRILHRSPNHLFLPYCLELAIGDLPRGDGRASRTGVGGVHRAVGSEESKLGDRLTTRREVLQLLAEGRSRKEIATALKIC